MDKNVIRDFLYDLIIDTLSLKPKAKFVEVTKAGLYSLKINGISCRVTASCVRILDDSFPEITIELPSNGAEDFKPAALTTLKIIKALTA